MTADCRSSLSLNVFNVYKCRRGRNAYLTFAARLRFVAFFVLPTIARPRVGGSITLKKVLAIFKNILVWLIVLVAVGMLIFTIISLTTVNHNDRSLFGYKTFIVLSDSMKATDFEAGDLVVSKAVDPRTLQAGDIISFQSTNPESYGSVVTHKIREVQKDKRGNPVFVTYGTTTNTNDKSTVAANRVLGQYQFRLAGVGRFFQFMKTVPGYILCIFLPFFVLIVIQGIESVRIFRAYRAEQLAELRSEREQLQIEREESKKMMEELQMLREELLAKQQKDAEQEQ